MEFNIGELCTWNECGDDEDGKYLGLVIRKDPISQTTTIKWMLHWIPKHVRSGSFTHTYKWSDCVWEERRKNNSNYLVKI